MAKILDIHLPNNITNALSRELGSDKTREFTMSDGGYILPRGYLSVLLQECAAALDAQTLGIFNGETWKYNVSMIDDDPLGQKSTTPRQADGV